MIKNRLNVVIGDNATELENFALKELAFFLLEIADTEVVAVKEFLNWNNAVYPCLFLGETELTKSTFNMEYIKEKVGQDGFFIKTDMKRAFICGGAGQGTVFGVYKFLEKFFNLKIYTKDVFTYEKKELEFACWETMEKPDFDMRAVGIYPVHLEYRNPAIGDKTYCYRMRLRQMDEGWGINNHSYFRVLPPDVYKKSHPDWYDETGKTLCLSNDEMTCQYIENMKVIIEKTPDDIYYMIGMEDSVTVCQCEHCKKTVEDHDGYRGALMLKFTNKVVTALNVWIKEKYPKRKIKFFTFAYMWAELPPVRKKSDGTFALLYEDIKPCENLGILLAPLRCNATFPLNDARNIESLNNSYHSGERVPVKDIFEGWKAVSEFVGAWIYNLNFFDYICPCPMWNGMDENFRWLKKLSCQYVFLEAGCNSAYSNFDKMKIYCASQLMWNSSLDFQTIIRDFMNVYYREAHEEIYQYFVEIHKHALWLDRHFDKQMVFVQFDDEPNIRVMKEEFWPQDLLQNWIKLFDNAVGKCHDPEIRNRVLYESVPVKFTYLYLYRNKTDKDYALKLIEELKHASVFNNIEYVWLLQPDCMSEVLKMWETQLI